MTESNAETTTDTNTHSGDETASDTSSTTETQGNPADGELGDAGKKALDRMKAERNEAAKRARALETELDKFRKASMSEAEKAVAEAETRGRQAATAEFGKRLARAQFDALAAKRNPDVSTDDLVEFVDMSRFIGDDGEVDAKAVSAAVERLVPAPPAGPPSFDGGVRKPADPGPDMNKLMRGALGRT